MAKRKSSIRLKVTLGYIVIIVCVLLSSILILEKVTVLNSKRSDVTNRNLEVHQMINTVEQSIIQIEKKQNSYILTGEKRYINEYEEQRINVLNDLENLKNVVAKQSNEKILALDLEKSVNKWITLIVEPSLKIREEKSESAATTFLKQKVENAEIPNINRSINRLRQEQNTILNDDTENLEYTSVQLMWIFFILILSIMLVGLFVSNYVSKNITQAIQNVKNTIQNIRQKGGDLQERIDITSRDEVRDLTIETNQLLNQLEEKEWVQNNVNYIIYAYQGVNDIHTLADVILSEISQVIHAVHGVFYLREEDDKDVLYVKKGAFAENNLNIGRESFKLGEGLIGQVAKDGHMYKMAVSPESTHVISTSLIDTAPRTLLLMPVYFNRQVIAVLEFATLDTFEEKHIQLLNKVNETLGISIDSVKRTMHIESLLLDSNRLTEELQAQSEELQTQSEELQAQTNELSTMNDSLAMRTKEAEARTRELALANRDIETRAREIAQGAKYKSEFLANMSHELRTPLNSILLLSEMLTDQENSHLSDEEKEFAKVIHSSGQDLLELINDILDLSKIETGKVNIEFSDVNISELPKILKANFAHFAKQKDLTYHIEILGEIPKLFFTDELRLRQILKNFLSNAFKFTEQGKVEVRIQSAALITEEMQKVSDDWLEIAVEDTGIGIPKEKHSIIFESFHQVDGATVRKYGGTGLGLAISKEYAKLLSGFIQVESEEGIGSTFKLYLPNMRQCQENIDAVKGSLAVQPEEKANIFQGKKILMIDDDRRNIYSMRTLLESKGAIVTSGESGLECLQKLQYNTDYDAVLMDIMMPGMNGYEVIQIIREQMNLDLPIIAITAKAMEIDRDQCMKVGASDYISKPLNMEQLLSILRVWLTKEVKGK
ncbi:ATP-binding protein [Kurthia gibsonii]|uniref:ATP-binding protein n=1 Tax=Kurthia gibsonii TaxID=33946 RepID=UPI0011415AA7|nr:ATP-binding protein [Kurthia gibsonii]GED18333.1 histidine kinase [Kurthia gibsonii]